MERDGINFVQIFHHNSTYNEFFTTNSAKLCFKKHTFSVISLIDDDFRFGKDSTFEFILEYPELKSEGCSLYHWTQSASLLSKVERTGYHHLEGPSFSGLSLSTNPEKTLIDGSPNPTIEDWWYSIGEKAIFRQKGFPGPECYYSYPVVKEVSLWIRFDNSSVLNKLYSITPVCSQKKKLTDDGLILSVLFITLIDSNK